jgi:peroxiredoxin Q/BCP
MTLKVGDKAPAIKSIDQDGNPISLAQFKGKKVILYFYPKDDTPGCTKEACNFRDNYTLLKKKGYEVLGVSIDSIKKHQKFIAKYELPFTLIADEEQKVVNDYGVWGLKKFMGREYMGISRTTFVIDEKGKIEQIIEKVDTTNSTAQVLNQLH